MTTRLRQQQPGRFETTLQLVLCWSNSQAPTSLVQCLVDDLGCKGRFHVHLGQRMSPGMTWRLPELRFAPRPWLGAWP